jgi:iron complex transport system permease protein
VIAEAPPADAVASAVAEGRRIARRYVIGLVVLLVVLVAAASLAMSVGAVHVRFGEVWSIIGRHVARRSDTGAVSSDDTIVWQIRAPRVVLGILAGAGLSVVGVVVQAMVRNPLADPYVMGVESGAAAAAVGVLYLGRRHVYNGSIGPSAAGFVGALVTLVVVFGLARRNGRVSSVRLLLVGVAVSYALGGVTSFFLYASHDPNGQGQVLFWILGGLGGAEWSKIPLALGVVLFGFVAMWYHARPLNALAVGDDGAASLGMNPDRLRTRLLVICALMVASLVSIVGPIGFVGLVVPHVGRMIFGAEHRRLIPVSMLLGGVYLVLVDIIARTLFAPSEIPIGVVTSVIGTPFFLWLIRRKGASVLQEAS